MGILTLSALLNTIKIPVNGYKICYILITIENSRRIAAMVGCNRKLRFYPREFTTLKGILR